MLYLEKAHPCPYLADEQCAHLILDRSQIETPWNDALFNHLLGAGFRHFGGHFYQPHCPECHLCQGMVIDPNVFVPNRSQRRVWQKNADLDVQVKLATAVVWTEHFVLLEAFHRARQESKDWPVQQWSPSLMMEQFAALPQSAVMEVRNQDGVLCGASCLDLTAHCQNHIYAYHQPQMSDRSLGTFMILWGIEWARLQKRSEVYLGLWNPRCSSLSYKQNFKPHRLLEPIHLQ